MKDEPEYIDLATYKRLSAKQPRKRVKRARRIDVPAAGPDPRDGLTTLLRQGWSTRTRNGGTEWQLYQNWAAFLATAWHSDQSLACAEASADTVAL